MFEYKKIQKFKLKSILTSKFKTVSLQQFKIFCLFFVVKQKNKNQILFFFLMIYLIFGFKPKILIEKQKFKTNFVCFKIKKSSVFILKFIIMYLVVLDTITSIKSKANYTEAYVIFNSFPIIYEVDILCENCNLFLDYIKNFKCILNAQLNKKIIDSFLWYFLECSLRIIKLPYKSIVRK